MMYHSMQIKNESPALLWFARGECAREFDVIITIITYNQNQIENT